MGKGCTALADGATNWFVVKDADVQIDGGVTCRGHVNLILCEGAKLTVKDVAEDYLAGIATDENGSFTIYGQPDVAGVYARGVVREAGDRIIVLNGVADEQVMEARVEKTGGGGEWRISSIPGERGYRPAEFAAQVRAAWPDQTNYWVAAEIGPDAFLREASKAHGARFYRMDGRDSTLGGWERRWEEAKAYLKSDDPFVPMMRRVFAREGNCIANAMLELESRVGGGERSLPSCARSALTSDDASPLTGQHGRARTPAAPQSLHNEIALKRDCGGPGVSALPQWNASGAKRRVHSPTPPQNSNSSAALAWQMYKRIYSEVDPGNFAALVNQCEMIRRGYKVSEEERRRVNRQLDDFFADPVRRSRAREIARSSGPVRSDPELITRLHRYSSATMRWTAPHGSRRIAGCR